MQFPKCDICGQDVQLKDGILSISFRDIQETQEARTKWEKGHRDPVLTAGDIMSYPSRIAWTWHHSKCEAHGSSYEIEGTRFDNIEAAMRWTLHLSEKNWFDLTNWADTIRRFFPELGE